MYDDYGQQAYDFLYRRSIILAQDTELIDYLANDLRSGVDLPPNQAAFQVFAERYVRDKLPIGKMDESTINHLVRYYSLIGQVNRPRPLMQAIFGVLTTILLVAALAGIATTIADNTTAEDINTATSAGRTILIVGVVIGLYYWATLKFQAILAYVRATLLLVLIVALVWLLHDNGIISLNEYF